MKTKKGKGKELKIRKWNRETEKGTERKINRGRKEISREMVDKKRGEKIKKENREKNKD